MSLTSRSYDYWATRRNRLFFLIALACALCLIPLWGKSLDMNIRVMLPQGQGIAQDLGLIERSPLSSIIFILIRHETGSQEILADVADQIISDLQGPHIDFFLFSPADVLRAMTFLVDNAPRLMGADDLSRLSQALQPDAIKKRMAENRRILASFQGITQKQLILRDPLGIRFILANRFAPLATLPQVRLASGHLISKDGTTLLLTARTDVPVTDAAGSAEILKQVVEVRKHLPSNTNVEIVSGHTLAVANAEALQQDLTIISLISFVFLLGVFLSLIRSPRALVVYLTPLAALAAALCAVAAASQSISAVVIGFGAVLLGIAEDYGMHVHFAMANNPDHPGQALSIVAKPIIYAAATSCAAFAVFLLSDIPGLRQLALFFLAGLGMSVVFSLLALPQMLSNLPLPAPKQLEAPIPTHQMRPAIFLCCIFGILCVIFAIRIKFNTDLRELGVVPKSVRQAEQLLSSSFGNLRGRALLFASGANANSALRNNEILWSTIKEHFDGDGAINIATLLPSLETQQKNLLHWREFWSADRLENVQHDLTAEANANGFTAHAFAPLKNVISNDPGPVVPETLTQYGLGILASLFTQTEPTGATTLITFIPDTPEVLNFFTPEREVETSAHLVSITRFRLALEHSMEFELILFLGTAAFAVVLLTAFLYRNVRQTVLAMTPPILGILAVLGWLGATATPLNIFHIAALPLVIGLGVGFGIFLVSAEGQIMPLATRKAVLASGLTSLGGFGVLALARHPALHSMGLAVLIGIGVSMAVALYILPRLIRGNT